MTLCEKLLNKEEKLSVVGLGYVGLPVAAAFARKFSVVGFDINEEKIALYRRGIDPTGEVGDETLKGAAIAFTADERALRQARFHVVAVPTPVGPDHTPDLHPVISASQIVGRNLTEGSIVVYESTVYPGVTEDVCIPILEEESGLKCGVGFKVGYSPERINPGDKVHRLETICKIVSGTDEGALAEIKRVYDQVIEAGTWPVSSIKTAEAIKVAENSQRDINIAFMNELAMVFDRMGIDTNEVVDGMNTKWNALGFRPGLVGGHCIGVDPYYLITKAQMLGVDSELISAARHVNDTLPEHIVNRLVQTMADENIPIKDASVLILGFTFKENCPDIRNTRVYDIYQRLSLHAGKIDVVDPIADPTQVYKEYGLKMTPMTTALKRTYDAVLLCVRHDVFSDFDIRSLIRERSVVYDIKSFLSDDLATLRM